jgi:hypothetical protein
VVLAVVVCGRGQDVGEQEWGERVEVSDVVCGWRVLCSCMFERREDLMVR